MACVMPMLVNKGSTSTIEERKTMVDTFLCRVWRNARPITINRSTIGKGMMLICTMKRSQPYHTFSEISADRSGSAKT